MDKHPKTGKSALEVIFTVLHAGGKFEAGNYKTAGGLHGVGASVVNALSKELVATVRRDGATWEQRFRQGKPQGALKKTGPARGTGTTVYFHPDPAIFPRIEFDAALLRERLEIASYLHRGVKLTFVDEGDRRRARRSSTRTASSPISGGSSPSAARAPVHEPPFTLHATATTATSASSSRCNGPSRPTSTSAATSTASPPARAARTRTACAPGSARRCATSSRRTTCRRRA